MKQKTQNIGVIACPSYIREKFDEMDQEYYGRIITLSKNTTSLLENKIVIVYIDNLLNLDKEYEDLSEKDQRLVHSIYVAYELYSFMRELLTTNGSITRIIKGYAWLWRNSTLLSKKIRKIPQILESIPSPIA